jgi:ketosteroid isomerase-like protein
MVPSGPDIRVASVNGLDLARQGISLFASRDVEAGLAILHPEAEWDVSEMMDGSVYKGHAAIRKHWEVLLNEVWESMEMLVQRLEQRGDDVIAHVQFKAVGVGSGAAIEVPITWIGTIEGDRFSRVKLSLDPQPADA